jgi:tRNA (Thr-GGU) A37 N-methylase
VNILKKKATLFWHGRIRTVCLKAVRIKKIKGNQILTTGLDLLDGTPILDIKPYIKDADVKPKANNGWAGRSRFPVPY